MFALKATYFFIFLLPVLLLPEAHAFGKPPAGSNSNQSGDLDIAVVLIDYPGAPDASLVPSADFLNEVFVGTQGGVSVSDAFAKLSEGRVKFRNYKIFGPYHLQETIYCDQEEKLWKLGVQAVGADVNFDQFSRVVYVMPRPTANSSCDYYGMIAAARADMECTGVETLQGNRCITFAWIGWQSQMQGKDSTDHDRTLSKYYVTKLITHEMLHGWNLMHNNTYADDFHDVIPPVNHAESRLEFGDSYPIMSSAGTGRAMGWLTGAHLVRLGWLGVDEWSDVRENGTFDIAPLAYGQKGLKVLRIPRKKAGESDPGDYLWIEYRKNLSAYDSVTFWPPNEYDSRHMGIVVHETSKALADGETVLLKFNAPAAPDFLHSDYRLPPSWQDSYTGVRLEILSQTSEKARIRVTFGN